MIAIFPLFILNSKIIQKTITVWDYTYVQDGCRIVGEQEDRSGEVGKVSSLIIEYFKARIVYVVN